MKISKRQFARVKKEAEAFYKKTGNVYCPYFKESVAFNAKGLAHIKFKSWNKARTRLDQYMRLRLIELAPKVLKLSHTLQGVSRTKSFEKTKINKRWDRVMRDVSYYEFVAVINDCRIRIIVKQIGQGQKYFWSIIPFWRADKDLKRILYSGRPGTD